MNQDFMPCASIDTLRARAKMLTKIRHFFDGLGFFEVQTPVLSHDTVVDRHIEPIALEVNARGNDQPDVMFLQSSPEFAMKRLLAAGADAIYQMGPAFRAGEKGTLHNIEFTMLEWYRVGDTYEQGMDLLDQFSQQVLGRPPATRLTYHEAIALSSGIDLTTKDGIEEFQKLQESLDTVDFSELLDQRIEPTLKKLGTAILYDWPADQAALARIRRDHIGAYGAFAERFELYLDGIEIANGYHELTEASELESRNRQVDVHRTNDKKPRLPIQSRLLDAMKHGLPDACGVALGVDRLMMIALDKPRIRDVLTFDIDNA